MNGSATPHLMGMKRSAVEKTVDALSRLEMPAGVYIDIKMKNK